MLLPSAIGEGSKHHLVLPAAWARLGPGLGPEAVVAPVLAMGSLGVVDFLDRARWWAEVLIPCWDQCPRVWSIGGTCRK